jgi:hypothetical protein
MVNILGAIASSTPPSGHMPQPGPSPIERPSTPVEQPQPPVLPDPPEPPVENPVEPTVPGDLPPTVPDVPQEG